MLVQMGAQIEGSGTSRILIRGVKKLHEYKKVPKDRIAAGTYLASAATRGKVTLDQAPVPGRWKQFCMFTGKWVDNTK